MREFREGDKVKILNDCSGAKRGEIYTLKYLLLNSGSKVLFATRLERMTTATRLCGCSCTHNWKLITKRVVKEYPIVDFMKKDWFKSK
jgi:hypothetical protein